MDNLRFDDLARLVGRGASRRAMLKLLTGGLAGGWAATALARVPAAGQGTCQEQGEPCQSGQPNGGCCCGLACLGDPGKQFTCLAVCRPEGTPCGVELPGCNDCCDDLPCVVATGASFGTCGGTVCGDIGEACETEDDCCAGLDCDGGTCKLSCGFEGVPCELAVVCCSGHVCDGSGICVPDGTACLGAGEACTSGGGGGAKRLLGAGGGGPMSCCFGSCCGGTCCGTDETCVEGICEPVGCPTGEVKVSDGTCCLLANVCGGIGVGDETVCCETGICCDGACIEGGDCCDDADCPSDETCVANVCQAAGEECPAGTVDVDGTCCPAADVCGAISDGTDGQAICCTGGLCCGDKCIAKGACCIDADCATGETCKDHVCADSDGPTPPTPDPKPEPTPATDTSGPTQLPSTGVGLPVTPAADAGVLAQLLAAGLGASAAAIAANQARRSSREDEGN